MHYGEILKRAWTLTWRYKILWLFGLLAGTGGGINFGGGGGGGRGSGDLTRPDGSPIPGMPEGMGDGMPWRDGGFGSMAMQWLQDNTGLVVTVVSVVAIVGLILFVLGIAAKGGLVHLSARADEGGSVVGSDGWRVGFRYWWRTVGTHLVIFLPLIAIIVLIAVILGAAGIGTYLAWDSGNQGLAGGGIVALIGMVLLFLPFLFIATLAANLVLELALRHAILADRPVLDAVGTAWRDLRGRFKDVFLMWLVMLLAGFVFAFVIAFAAAALLAPAVMAGYFGDSIRMAVLLGIPGLLVLLLPVAMYAAWRSTAWTLFWRQLAEPSTAP